MRFDQSQHLRMGQHMKLAPHMIQSMEILQMSIAELEERIEQELESNPTLEQADPGSDAGADANAERGDASHERASDDATHAGDADDRPLTVDESGGEEEFARLDSFEGLNPEIAENQYDADAPPSREREWEDRLRRESASPTSSASGATSATDPDDKAEALAAVPARGQSLQEALREQWGVADVDESLRPLGEHIIAYVEDDGYLRTPLEAIVERLPADAPRPAPAQMERALQAVQLLLEPAGVAARDRRECLLLQIDATDDDDAPRSDPGAGPTGLALVRALVADHFDDVLNNRLPKVAARLGVDVERVKAGVERLRRFSLTPARALASESPGVIYPDAVVEYDPEHDRYVAYLTDSRFANLRVNQEYARLAKDRTAPKATREFIRKNLGNAHFLLDAIEQRRRTLRRVVEAVVEAQREFFDYGPQALRPLPMTRVAEQLGVHVATVSRAVADKHLLTPRGVVPLRRFFSGGTQSDSGEDVSWDAIKAALQEIVDGEDKHNPLSDDALADELKKRGLNVARRTVAKYRGQLGVPTARLRKAY